MNTDLARLRLLEIKLHEAIERLERMNAGLPPVDQPREVVEQWLVQALAVEDYESAALLRDALLKHPLYPEV